MTIEQLIEKAQSELAAKREQIMAELEVMLTKNGATPEEQADTAEWYGAMIDEQIAKQMPKIEAWLRRGGEELH